MTERISQRILSDHREIVVVLALFIALCAVYSVTTPLFEAPDEQWHYAYVQYVATGHGLPVQSPDPPAHLARQEGSQPPLYYLLAAALTFWIDTSDFPGIVWENPHYGYNVPGIVNDNKNLFIHTSLESPPYRGAVLAIHLARFLSVLMGAFAVLFTYLLVLEILPDRRYLAVSAAAIAAFVPQFLFVSGAVSNDSTIVAAAGLSLWLMVRLLVRHQTAFRGMHAIAAVSGQPSTVSFAAVALLGVATGLAALAKVSGAGLVVLGGIVLLYVLRKQPSRLVVCAAIFSIVALVVAGWWYLRNWSLYGELTGTAMMVRIFGAREMPLTERQLLTQLGEVWETFWVGFGWGNIRAQPMVYGALQVLAMASGIGLVLGIVRRRRRSEPTLAKALPFIVLAAWIVIAFVELVHWMQITQAPHGRLFFPVLPALAPLAALGLTQWVPQRIAPLVARLCAGLLFALAVFAPFGILQPAFAFPQSATSEPRIPRRVDMVYGDKIKLLGYGLSATRAKPGDWLELTLYWQSLIEMEQDYSVGIHLLDSAHRVISSRDSYPGHGMLPTSLWHAGQIVIDPYWVPISANAPDSDIADIHISLYARETKQELPALDPRGQAVTPIIGRLRIAGMRPPPSGIPNETQFLFGGQATLMGYAISRSPSGNLPQTPGQSADAYSLTLFWKRVAVVSTDYTVFVHVVDANGQIIAQRDQEPGGGSSPTSLWEEGEVIVDRYDLAFDSRSPLHVEAGLYDARTGERLPVVDADGIPLGDHVEFALFGAGK